MNADVIVFSIFFIVSTSLTGMAICRMLGRRLSKDTGSILPITEISTPMPPVKPPKSSGANVPIPEKPTPRTKDHQNWA